MTVEVGAIVLLTRNSLASFAGSVPLRANHCPALSKVKRLVPVVATEAVMVDAVMVRAIGALIPATPNAAQVFCNVPAIKSSYSPNCISPFRLPLASADVAITLDTARSALISFEDSLLKL